MPDNSARIAAINKILESGVKTVIVDNITTHYDHDSLRAERTRLQREDSVKPRKIRRTRRIDLSGG